MLALDTKELVEKIPMEQGELFNLYFEKEYMIQFSPTLGEKSFLRDTTELEEIIHMERGN